MLDQQFRIRYPPERQDAYALSWVDQEACHIVIEIEEGSLEALAGEARRSYRTVEDMVHEVVREAIVTGVYRPGDRLPQDSIAESIGVSRIPVRAALRSLEAEGFVVLEPHKGATVRALSAAEIAEIYELRALLETYAVRAVAEKITDEELGQVAALAVAMDEAQDPEFARGGKKRLLHHAL